MVPISAGISKVAWDHKNGSHQCLSLYGESQLVPASPVDISRLVNGSSSPMVHELFNLVFLLFMSYELCVGLLRAIFCSVQFCGFPEHTLCRFSETGVLGVLSLVQDLGCLIWSLNPSSGERSDLCVAPNYGFPWLGYGFYFGETLFASSTHLDAVLSLPVVDALFIQFSGPFMRESFRMYL